MIANYFAKLECKTLRNFLKNSILNPLLSLQTQLVLLANLVDTNLCIESSSGQCLTEEAKQDEKNSSTLFSEDVVHEEESKSASRNISSQNKKCTIRYKSYDNFCESTIFLENRYKKSLEQNKNQVCISMA